MALSDKALGVFFAKRKQEIGEDVKAKAAALDKILASWGMTWEQYRTQTGKDAPAHGREPNEHGKENRVEAPQGDDPRRA